jgi:putative transposase
MGQPATLPTPRRMHPGASTPDALLSGAEGEHISGTQWSEQASPRAAFGYGRGRLDLGRASQTPPPPGAAVIEDVTPAIARWAYAKGEICNHLGNLQRDSRLTRGAALKLYLAAYASGEALVSDDTRVLIPELSGPTVTRWLRKFEHGGVAALLPLYGNRRGQGRIDAHPELSNFILAKLAQSPHTRAVRIAEYAALRFGAAAPSAKQVSEFIRTWRRDNPHTAMLLRNPDRAKSKYLLALGSQTANVHAVGDRWEIDGSSCDVACLDGRYHLNLVIDIYSRRMVAQISPTASGAATASLLLKAFGELGIPKLIRSDWGSEYLNARIQAAMGRLDIEWRKVARPYSGALKGSIERANKTALHGFFEECPGFIGHSVADAQEIRARHSFEERRTLAKARRAPKRAGESASCVKNLGPKRVKLYNIALTAADLQRDLDTWINAIYAERPHAGLLGRTPNQVFADADQRGEVRRAEYAMLALAMGEGGAAVVGKRGLVCGGLAYWADELTPWMGRRVDFVRDPDLGRIHAFSQNKFICVAVNAEHAGIDQQAFALAGREAQKQFERAELAEARQRIREHHPATLQRELLDHAAARAALAATPPASNIKSLPYRAPELEKAAAARAALDNPVITPHQETAAEAATALADIDDRRDRRALMLDDDELDALWVAICRDTRNLSLREQRFLSHFGVTAEQWSVSYESSSDFAAMRRIDTSGARASERSEQASLRAASRILNRAAS